MRMIEITAPDSIWGVKFLAETSRERRLLIKLYQRHATGNITSDCDKLYFKLLGKQEVQEMVPVMRLMRNPKRGSKK